MSLDVTAVAECHKIVPVEPLGWVSEDGHYVVYLTGRRHPLSVPAVLTEWIDCPIPLGKHVPAVIVVLVGPLWWPTALTAAFAAVCVSLGAESLHGR